MGRLRCRCLLYARLFEQFLLLMEPLLAQRGGTKRPQRIQVFTNFLSERVLGPRSVPGTGTTTCLSRRTPKSKPARFPGKGIPNAETTGLEAGCRAPAPRQAVYILSTRNELRQHLFTLL